MCFLPPEAKANLDVNVTVGSIFSIVAAKSVDEVLQPGRMQVAAGFASYGPSTTLVISFGDTSALFVLEESRFVLNNRQLRIPDHAAEFAINVSRQQFWEQSTRRYVADCIAGETGPLGTRYNMRWVGSMVAEVHRILMRGGIFIYPVDSETAAAGGRLRLLYEINPMALIVEAAQGTALARSERVLLMQPAHLHQRAEVVLGSSDEVRIYVEYQRSAEAS